MTDQEYPYDPATPYVTVVNESGRLIARFAYKYDAVSFTGHASRVIDTTPKPRVPEDARFITWERGSARRYAEKLSSGEWHNDNGSIYATLEDLPGVTPETTFTVLEERKS